MQIEISLAIAVELFSQFETIQVEKIITCQLNVEQTACVVSNKFQR